MPEAGNLIRSTAIHYGTYRVLAPFDGDIFTPQTA